MALGFKPLAVSGGALIARPSIPLFLFSLSVRGALEGLHSAGVLLASAPISDALSHNNTQALGRRKPLTKTERNKGKERCEAPKSSAEKTFLKMVTKKKTVPTNWLQLTSIEQKNYGLKM